MVPALLPKIVSAAPPVGRCCVVFPLQKSTLLFLSPTSRRGARPQDALKAEGEERRRRRRWRRQRRRRQVARSRSLSSSSQPEGRSRLSGSRQAGSRLRRHQPRLLGGLLGDFRLLVLILFPVAPAFRSGFGGGAGNRRGGPGRRLRRSRGPAGACAGGGRGVRQRRPGAAAGRCRGPVPAQLRGQAQRRRRRSSSALLQRQQEATLCSPPCMQRAHQLLRGQKQRLRLVGWTSSLQQLPHSPVSALGVSAVGAAGLRGEGGLWGAVAVSAEGFERLQGLVGWDEMLAY